jgi:flagellar biosynthesis protein
MADQPRKRAVALRYDPARDAAPKLVAKGQGRIADQILELARKNDVPVREDANLVQVLSRLNLDQEIPKEVYQAVATILAFLYKVNRPAER